MTCRDVVAAAGSVAQPFFFPGGVKPPMSDSSSYNLLMVTGVLALLVNVGLTSAMAVQTNRVNKNLEAWQMMKLHSAYVEDVETFIDPITKHVEGLASTYTPAGRRRLQETETEKPVSSCHACYYDTVRTFNLQKCDTSCSNFA